MPYERYVLALCEAETNQHDANRIERCIAQAKFPVVKDPASFDFNAAPTIPKMRVLALAQGGYMARAETIILLGNPGLGKTHIATGLALAACKQGKRVRFYTAASLVNDLVSAQKDLQKGARKPRALKPGRNGPPA